MEWNGMLSPAEGPGGRCEEEEDDQLYSQHKPPATLLCDLGHRSPFGERLDKYLWPGQARPGRSTDCLEEEVLLNPWQPTYAYLLLPP